MNDIILNFLKDKSIQHTGTKKVGDKWVYLFKQEVRGYLSFIEERPIVMLIKKKWWRADWWSPRIIDSHKGLGHTIPFELYDILKKENNRITQLVFYIMADDEYYKTDAGKVIDFVEKYGTRFQDNYNNDVVGIPKEIFNVH